MSNPVVFQRDGNTYTVYGLAERAAAIAKAAAQMDAITDAQVRSAKAALRQWEGRYAADFVTKANDVLSKMAAMKHALAQAAGQLVAFPESMNLSAVDAIYAAPDPKVAAVRPVTRGRAGADPEKLLEYAVLASAQKDDFVPLAATVRLEPDVYATVTFYPPLNALPNLSDRKFETQPTAVKSLIQLPEVWFRIPPLKAALDSASALAKAVALALSKLDKSAIGVHSTDKTGVLDALVEGLLRSPNTSPVEALASYFVAQLGQIDTLASDEAAIVRQRTRFAQLLVDMRSASLIDPKFADAFIEKLGADGVHKLVDRMRDMQTGQPFYGPNAFDGKKLLLVPFAEILAIASRDGGADPKVLRAISAGPSSSDVVLNTALLLGVSKDLAKDNLRYGRDFLKTAFLNVWKHGAWVGSNDDLARRVMGGNAQIGALEGLSTDAALSWSFVTAPTANGLEKNFRHKLLFLQDLGPGGGAVLSAALHDYVVSHITDPNVHKLSTQIYGEIVKEVADENRKSATPWEAALVNPALAATGLLKVPAGDHLSPAACVALARISILHWADLQFAANLVIAKNNHEHAGFKPNDLRAFLKDLQADPGAQQILDQGLAIYSGQHINEGVRAAVVKHRDLATTVGEYARRVGALAGLLHSGQRDNVKDEAKRQQFLIAGGTAALTALVAAGLAAAPLSGGASAVAGAAAGFGIDQAMQSIPPSTFDAQAMTVDFHEMIRAQVAFGLVHYGAKLESSNPDWLRKPQHIADVIQGKEDETYTFEQILGDDSPFSAAVDTSAQSAVSSYKLVTG
jgi:hypothetical protein